MNGKDKTFILIRKRTAGFRLIQRQLIQGKTKTKTLDDSRIDTINILYSKGDIPEVTAIARLKAVRESMYRQMGKLMPLGNTDNDKVLESFWKHYKKKHRNISDKDSAYSKFRRAIEVLGPLNITTALEEEIQDALDTVAKKKGWSANNHQKLGGALRAILKSIGRADVDLTLKSSKKSEVAHLTEDEVKKLATSVPNENLQLLILSAFYTGMRIGELMFIKSGSIVNGTVHIKKQLKRDGTIADTKTGLNRQAFIIAKGEDNIKKWANTDKKLPMKQENISHYIRKQSEKVLNKSIKFHDLRHSYAVYMVQKGAPLELVAQSMGNTVKVCEKHYSGYQLTNLGIETLKRIMK